MDLDVTLKNFELCMDISSDTAIMNVSASLQDLKMKS